jgi:uncharacterized protein (DUF952 family)
VALIYKIVGAEEWSSAVARGRYSGSADDCRDGYIHFSNADQVATTARKYFAGRTDLLLVAVARTTLGSALKDEVSRGGALFPHLYAELSTAAVAWVRPMPLGPDGQPALPAEVM